MAKATIRYNAGNGMWIEVEAENVKAAVSAMATYQEVFAEPDCGCCGHKAIIWECRQDKEGNDYYAIHCPKCNAQLSFGQTRVGERLFTKRKEHPKTRGWYHWQPRSSDDMPDDMP